MYGKLYEAHIKFV